MANQIRLEILDVLANSTIKGNLLYFPDVERSLYVEIKDLLARCGGHWKASKKAHEFPDDPTNIINSFLKIKMWPEKNPYAFFPSPKVVVDEAINLIQNKMHGQSPKILEPSAGTGAFAQALRKEFPNGKLTLCEFNENNAFVLRKQGFDVHQMDFLEFNSENEFDLVLMNPPFSYDGHPNAWIEHIMHAFSLLNKNGNLYAVVPDFFHKNGKLIEQFKELLSKHIFGCQSFEKGTFKESGTNVETKLIALSKEQLEYSDMEMYISNDRKIYEEVINSKEIELDKLEQMIADEYAKKDTYLRYNQNILKEAAMNVKLSVNG